MGLGAAQMVFCAECGVQRLPVSSLEEKEDPPAWGRAPEAPAKPCTAAAQDSGACRFSGFLGFPLRPELHAVLHDYGFEDPSVLQRRCLPPAIDGQHVLCEAAPGMGRTLVIVLSALQALDPAEGRGLQCLILCNSQWRAIQIARRFDEFLPYMPHANVVVCGNHRLTYERLQGSPNIVVGSVKSAQWFAAAGDLELGTVTQIVVDQAESCVLFPKVREALLAVLRGAPGCRQAMLFSGLSCHAVDMFAQAHLRAPCRILLPPLEHRSWVVSGVAVTELCHLLQTVSLGRVVVFVDLAATAHSVTESLRQSGLPALHVHPWVGSSSSRSHVMVCSGLEATEYGKCVGSVNCV